MPLLSLIIPCFNEADVLPMFIQEIERVKQELGDTTLELIFINDGSTDNTLQIIRQLADENEQMRYISFSRNFGKEAGVIAGLKACTGEYAAIIDADLQHPPSLLPEMLRALQVEGYDCAGTYRSSRDGEPYIRSMFARLFYRIINSASSTKLVDGACDYKLMKRSVVNALLQLQEYNRFSKGLNEWVGFKTKWLPFKNVERVAGQTKWSFFSLFNYSIEGITSFSTAPLLISSFAGLIMVLFSFSIIFTLILRKLVYGNTPDGWTALICTIIFFSGIQLIFLGVLGLYIAKMYMEIKKRPHYIISEQSN